MTQPGASADDWKRLLSARRVHLHALALLVERCERRTAMSKSEYKLMGEVRTGSPAGTAKQKQTNKFLVGAAPPAGSATKFLVKR